MTPPATSSFSPTSSNSPLAPDLVLRVGFAGKRQLDRAQTETVRNRLLDVFSVIGWRLVEISPLDDATNERPVPAIAKFYSHKRPTFRLILGLCDGADSIASEVQNFSIQESKINNPQSSISPVVPFPIADYRASRDPDFLPEFDQQLAACSYVVVPDGIYDKPESAISSSSNQKSTIENPQSSISSVPDISPVPLPPERLHLSNRRRARAYRCQSAILLRQSDLLVAVVNPDLGGKPGGTLETVRSALDFELPVVLVHPDTGEVFLIEPGDDLLAVLTHDSGISTGWQETLATWVTQITADPERSEDATGNASASHGLGLMNEFFHQVTTQPGSHPIATAPARKTIRERLWVKFLKRFKPAQTKTPSGPSAAAFAPWRNRASELSGRYSGLYRGTYFLNHLLAVTAVLLAAWSLVLMGKTSTQLTEWVQGAADVAHIAQAATDAAKKSSDFAPWVFPVLLALAALKLWIVVFIFRSTHAASSFSIQKSKINNPQSSISPVLPLIGSFQPPAAAPAQYASRVVRQSAVDWLFDAIIRSVSPAQFTKDTEIRSFEANYRHASPSSN